MVNNNNEVIREIHHREKIEIEVADHSTIDEVLDEFQNFLRGCGYVIEYNQCLTFVDMDK